MLPFNCDKFVNIKIASISTFIFLLKAIDIEFSLLYANKGYSYITEKTHPL